MTRRPRVAPPDDAPRPLPLWAGACFLVSGAAGLVYEVVWSKQISYLLGNSLQAVATVVAAFLTGLALGAYLLGARVARRRQGAKAYALLEFGIGLCGLLSIPVLRGLDPVVGALYRGLGGETGPFALARLVLLFLLLLPPTALMGATLPVLVGHFEYRRVGPALARLYALNTAGAVLGAALAGFVLMPGLGLAASAWLAVALNAAAGMLAWSRAGRTEPGRAVAIGAQRPAAGPAPVGDPGKAAVAETASEPPPLPGPLRAAAAVLFAFSGFAALVFQIAWVRLFALLLGSSVYSFSAVLVVYLTGLAGGSALVAPALSAARGKRRPARLLALFGALQALVALSALASVYLFPRLPEAVFALGQWAAGSWARLYAGELGLITAVLLLPCLAFGAAFPLTARLQQSRDGGHATGLAYAVNTVGTLAGSLLAGFLLVPRLGVQGTHVVAALVALAVGLAALLLASAVGLARGRTLWGAGLAVALALALWAGEPAWHPALMAAGVYRPNAGQALGLFVPAGTRDPVLRFSEMERVLFYREGINCSVYVGSDSSGGEVFLKVDGKADASTNPNDMATQILLGLLPGSMVPRGARAAVVGLGSGLTLSGILAAGAGSVEVMELEPAVVQASRFFDEPGRRPLDDPRVRLILGDARTRFFNTHETFDAIVSEPSNPWVAGVNNLFTVDFYRRLRARLAPQGVFCQWIQLYELSPEMLDSMLSSFLEVFPDGYAFRGHVDLLLLAGPRGMSLPLERLRAPEAVHQLRRAALSPEAVSAWYACPFDSLRPLIRGAPLNRDDLPVVEYRAPRDMVRIGWRRQAVDSLIPSTGLGPARSLFAGWPTETWYRARVKELVRKEKTDLALATATDAATEGMQDLARELTVQVETHERSETARRQARKAALGGRLAVARDILRDAVRVTPDDGGLWLLFADANRLLGDEKAALDAAAHAVTVGDSTSKADAFVVMGMIAMTGKRTAEALEASRQAVRWMPGSEKGWLLQAQALSQAGNVDEAAAVCRRALVATHGSSRIQSLLSGLERGR
jgi:spermidine synthase